MLVTRRIRAHTVRARERGGGGVNEGWFNFTTACRSIRPRSTHIFHRVPWSGMAEAASESINCPRVSPAGQKYTPFYHSVVCTGRASKPSLPSLLRIFLSTRADTWQCGTIWQPSVCAARSARILDNDGAQYIANHAWRAQQSRFKTVQIRDDHRPGECNYSLIDVYLLFILWIEREKRIWIKGLPKLTQGLN